METRELTLTRNQLIRDLMYLGYRIDAARDPEVMRRLITERKAMVATIASLKAQIAATK
jgi:hypothetical protein